MPLRSVIPSPAGAPELTLTAAAALVLAVPGGQLVGDWASPVSILGSATLALSVVLLVLRIMGDHERVASPDGDPGVSR